MVGDGDQGPEDARPPTADAGRDVRGGDPDLPGGVEQGPVTFVVTNRTGEARYLRWSEPASFEPLLGFERRVADEWTQVSMQEPFCVVPCDEVESVRPQRCCIDCAAPRPAMRLLRPGESIEWLWSGKRFVIDNQICECGCSRPESPEPGRYRATVATHTAVRCGGTTCDPPNEQGVIALAEPAGTASTHGAEFDVVTTKSRIEISLQ